MVVDFVACFVSPGLLWHFFLLKSLSCQHISYISNSRGTMFMMFVCLSLFSVFQIVYSLRPYGITLINRRFHTCYANVGGRCSVIAIVTIVAF